MVREALDTVDEILEGAMNDIDDSDGLYKIRSARQLLELAKQRHRDHDEAIEEIISDDEVLDDLRDLGYVE
jgi:hypothetical protein